MENLRIEFSYDKETFKREQKLIWQLLWKKNKRTLKGTSTFAVIFLISGILFYLNDMSDYFFLILAAFYAFLVLLLFIWRKSSQIKQNKLIGAIADRYEKEKMNCIYELSEDSLKYWDNEKHFQYAWSMFGGYTTYKNYLLLLHRDNLKTPLLVFENNDLYTDKFEQFKTFIESKLEYKDSQFLY